MKVKIMLEKENTLLKRREVHFQVKHDHIGSTPQRLEIKKAVADALKVKADFVFINKLKTKTGMHTAVGLANVYHSIDQATLVEPEYIIKRNIPPEKPKEEKE
jgi:ribosomal protein S24E